MKKFEKHLDVSQTKKMMYGSNLYRFLSSENTIIISYSFVALLKSYIV